MKISIITVSYNAVATIEDTIHSVLNQSYEDLEYVIIDGGSNDGTLDIIEKYRDKIARIISEKDDGIYYGMNKGIAACSGDYIGILNADDVYYNDSIVQQVASSLSNSKTDSLYGDLLYVQEDNLEKVTRTWNAGKFNKSNFLMGWMPPHPTFFVRRSIYGDFGVFNTEFKIAADYELMLRLLYKREITTQYLNTIMIKMRVGGVSNSSFKNRLSANQEDRMAWKVNGLKPKWYTLYLKPISKLAQFIKK